MLPLSFAAHWERMNELYSGWNPFCGAQRADPKLKMPQDQPAPDETTVTEARKSSDVKSNVDYEIVGRAKLKSYFDAALFRA